MSYVYVIGPRVSDGALKIGRSRQPIIRLSQLGAECGRILFEHKTQNASGVEATAHFILANSRLDGEWFDVSADAAEDAVLRAAWLCEMPLVVPVTEWPPRIPDNFRDLVRSDA